MNIWYIYLKCFDGTTGYFTGIIKTSTGQEVGLHPYKNRAYRFEKKDDAFNMARTLKHTFPCIAVYSIIN